MRRDFFGPKAKVSALILAMVLLSTSTLSAFSVFSLVYSGMGQMGKPANGLRHMTSQKKNVLDGKS